MLSKSSHTRARSRALVRPASVARLELALPLFAALEQEPSQPEPAKPSGAAQAAQAVHPLVQPAQAADLAVDLAVDLAADLTADLTAGLKVDLTALHSSLWRASQLAQPRQSVWPTGYAALDAVLPGGGWPAATLTELLLPHAGVGELRLLAPVLAQIAQQGDLGQPRGSAGPGQQGRSLMWFAPPALPNAWALAALGVPVQQLILVGAGLQPRSDTRQDTGSLMDTLWALEQSLRSGCVGAVLAWLPARMPRMGDALRRLQLAAQHHSGPAFLLRGEEAAQQSSPAMLRLHLSAGGVQHGPDALCVRVLKRRGPALAEPVVLALPPVLADQAKQAARQRLQAAGQLKPGSLLPQPMPPHSHSLLPLPAHPVPAQA